MDARTDYLLQILDKIGGPLVAALAHTARVGGASASSPEDKAREDAQTIAQLLARSVQISIDIGRMMELDMSDPEAADRLRLALMVLSGPLVAGQYRHEGRVPGDAEQKKIMTGLEAVLAFSQNFAPTRSNAAGLAGGEAGGQSGEGAEAIRALQCFVPVINAVGAFPFGQPEKKLIQDVAMRITARADDLAAALKPAGASGEDKWILLRALADIYAECHAEETRLMLAKDPEEADIQKGLEAVWARFDIRSAMLEVLSGALVSGGAAPESLAPVPSPESPASPPKPTIFSSPAAAQSPLSPSAPADETPPPPETQDTASSPPPGFNPMALFSKKDTDTGAAADVPPPSPPSASAAPAQTPPLSEAQPEEPPVAVPPPSQEPPAESSRDENKTEGGRGEDESDSGSGAPPASPMSFFKKGD